MPSRQTCSHETIDAVIFESEPTARRYFEMSMPHAPEQVRKASPEIALLGRNRKQYSGMKTASQEERREQHLLAQRPLNVLANRQMPQPRVTQQRQLPYYVHRKARRAALIDRRVGLGTYSHPCCSSGRSDREPRLASLRLRYALHLRQVPMMEKMHPNNLALTCSAG